MAGRCAVTDVDADALDLAPVPPAAARACVAASPRLFGREGWLLITLYMLV